MDHPDRVLAATTRPEPVLTGLEPGFPLRLQRIADPSLMAAIHEHRNSGRPQFCTISRFRYVHAPDRAGLPRADGLVHPHRHIRPRLRGQRDLPVDPRRHAPSIALRHPPHADQRVGPAAQHQLLQIPDPRPALFPARLEDPLPQPRYLPLWPGPQDRVPLARALPHREIFGSVHHQAPNLPLSSGGSRTWSPKAHPPTSARFRARTRRVSGQLYETASEGASRAASLSCRLSATGIRLLGILAGQGVTPLLRPAYRPPGLATAGP